MIHRTLTSTAKLSPSVHTRLSAFLEQQRLVSNAALEERIGAYRQAGVSVSLYAQNKSLTELRKDQAFSQYDLKCQRSCLFTLDRAFKGFFRRVKAGQQPGFPRFKSKDRGMRSFSTTQLSGGSAEFGPRRRRLRSKPDGKEETIQRFSSTSWVSKGAIEKISRGEG